MTTMTPAFEQLLCPNAPTREAFMRDCQECFGTLAGQRVLAALVAGAHPLQHTPGMTEHEHGRREVVATLWRFGAGTTVMAVTEANAAGDAKAVGTRTRRSRVMPKGG